MSGTRRSAAIIPTQASKRAKVPDSVILEIVVFSQLALANKDGRIAVSLATTKKGRPIEAKNEVKGDEVVSSAIVERSRVRERKS
ncbi:hypothetical protein M0R45_002180 [Rubus argutus]|uniref:Uncharacterized protein n=1 Tax=Rubus argutus TaxID=59490 RepID=A0AAW1VQK9_RUBAR